MKSKWRSKGLWGMVILVLGVVVILSAAKSQADSDSDGWLGIVIQNIDKDLQESEGLPSTDGVFVIDVVDGSPAEKAGLERGDVILEFDGREARSVRRLTRDIEWAKPGDDVQMVVLKDGKEKKTVTITVGEDKGRDHDWSFFGPGDMNWVTPPAAPDAPDAPAPPHAWAFSLGQLSGNHIGVSLYDLSDQLAKHYGATDGGALINEVVKDSPAEKAGLEAGDVIVKLDGNKVEDTQEIREAIADKDEGDKVAVTVLRNGSEKTFDVDVEESDTWSGVGDMRALPRGHAPRVYSFGPQWNDAHENMREALRDNMREAMRGYRDTQGEWRDELQEQLKDLREQLQQLKKELREKGF